MIPWHTGFQTSNEVPVGMLTFGMISNLHDLTVNNVEIFFLYMSCFYPILNVYFNHKKKVDCQGQNVALCVKY